jgi:starvation-inducible DNA-binding protein
MLTENLKVLLASTYAYYLKAKFFHWNTEGSDFIQLHAFFDQVATDSYEATDVIAEEIRTLEANAPGSFERFIDLSIIPGQTKIPRARLMVEELLADTQTMIDLVNQVFHDAEEEDKQDIANFMAERLSSHNKWMWQMKSLLKDVRE